MAGRLLLLVAAVFLLSGCDLSLKSAPSTAEAYALVRERVPFLARDTDFQPYIAAMEELVLSGKLAAVPADVNSEERVGI